MQPENIHKPLITILQGDESNFYNNLTLRDIQEYDFSSNSVF